MAGIKWGEGVMGQTFRGLTSVCKNVWHTSCQCALLSVIMSSAFSHYHYSFYFLFSLLLLYFCPATRSCECCELCRRDTGSGAISNLNALLYGLIFLFQATDYCRGLLSNMWWNIRWKIHGYTCPPLQNMVELDTRPLSRLALRCVHVFMT